MCRVAQGPCSFLPSLAQPTAYEGAAACPEPPFNPHASHSRPHPRPRHPPTHPPTWCAAGWPRSCWARPEGQRLLRCSQVGQAVQAQPAVAGKHAQVRVRVGVPGHLVGQGVRKVRACALGPCTILLCAGLCVPTTTSTTTCHSAPLLDPWLPLAAVRPWLRTLSPAAPPAPACWQTAGSPPGAARTASRAQAWPPLPLLHLLGWRRMRRRPLCCCPCPPGSCWAGACHRARPPPQPLHDHRPAVHETISASFDQRCRAAQRDQWVCRGPGPTQC